MKQKILVLSLISAAVIISAALIAIAARPVPVAAHGINVAALTAADDASLNLQCSVKVPFGFAQCGSQASSCKNCHEVKGEDSVNAKGDWHISHAFGDFCEFCHGGNVQTPDKDAAHQGLVEPLGDVKVNCSSCHADDYQAKAEKYASTLGVTVGSGGGQPPSQPAQPQQPAQPPQPAAQSPSQLAQQSAPQTEPKPAPAASTSKAEVIDYTKPAPDGAVNWGNLIVGLLLAITVVGGGAFVYWNEKRLRKLVIPKAPEGYVTYETGSAVAPSGEKVAEVVGELSPELKKLLPTLLQLDPRTLRALRIILSDRKRGEELLQSLSVINFSVLEEMKRLDKKELSLLLALAAES